MLDVAVALVAPHAEIRQRYSDAMSGVLLVVSRHVALNVSTTEHGLTMQAHPILGSVGTHSARAESNYVCLTKLTDGVHMRTIGSGVNSEERHSILDRSRRHCFDFGNFYVLQFKKKEKNFPAGL